MKQEHALRHLPTLFLMHNRDIHIRCDDSVVRVFSEQLSSHQLSVNNKQATDHRSLFTYPLRRSRGYSPFPVKLPWEVPHYLPLARS